MISSEVESSLNSAKSLHSSFRRILLTLPPESHPTSDELSLARSELKTILSALVDDISELDEVVAILEEDLRSSSASTTRFGVSRTEVKKRRAWIENVQSQLEHMQKTAHSKTIPNDHYHPLMESNSPVSVSVNKKPNSVSNTTNQLFRDDPAIDVEDSTEQYHQEHQTMMMEQQDKTLGTISGVVGVLREQASLMGREISEHNILLEDLEGQIDTTESRLSKANKKLNQFVKDNKDSKSSWFILLLIILLVCLLIAIILV